MSWTIYGLVTSLLGEDNGTVEIPGLETTIPMRSYLKENFGFDYDFLPIVALTHVGWLLIFLFTYAYGIKNLNFQTK